VGIAARSITLSVKPRIYSFSQIREKRGEAERKNPLVPNIER
jgi:hypothetical protein